MKVTAAFRRNIACSVAAVAAAVLLYAAYVPYRETLNVIVALVPMLVIARVSRPGRSALFFFLFGFVYWALSVSWLPAIVKNNGPWPLVALGWFTLSTACAGYFALFGWMAARMWRFSYGRPSLTAVFVFGEAVLWVVVEWLRATLFTGFPWNFLGTAFAEMPAFATPARFGGVYLVSALTVLLNGVFATLFLRIASPVLGIAPAGSGGRFARICETALPLGAILACLVAGNRMVAADKRGVDAVVRVALVQRNAPCCFKPGARENPIEAFGRLIDAVAAVKPDLVVLAESAMCEFGAVRSFRAQDAAREFLARSGAKALIAGGDDKVDGRMYNGAAFYTADGEAGAGPLQVYHKQHLVPFGEYIPFDKIITPLQKLSPIGVSLYTGKPRLFELPLGGGRTVKIAPLICYEDTVPSLSSAAAAAGADMIVVITNDSWFSNSAEAESHASQAVMRALETALPVVRVGNSGVTGVIRPDGSANWLRGNDGKVLVDRPGVMVETVAVRCKDGEETR